MQSKQKKIHVNFPDEDKYWIEVKAYLDKAKENKEHDFYLRKILAPIEFIKYYKNVLPYNFSYIHEVDFFEYIILHKGELEYLEYEFLKEATCSLNPVFANPVFIVYSRHTNNCDIHKKCTTFKLPKFHKRKQNKIKEIALIGANQFGNLGDDAIAWSSYDMLQEVFPKAKVRIYSPPVSKKSIFTADLLVLSGGGIFYDGCIYNAMNYTRYIAWAEEASIPSCGIGIGTQGIYTDLGKQLYRESLNSCEFISVRDPDDLKVLKEDLGLDIPIHLTQDMVFSLNRQAKNKRTIPKSNKLILFYSLMDSNFLIASKKMESYRQTAQKLLVNLQTQFDLWCIVQSKDDLSMYLDNIEANRIIKIPFNDVGQAVHLYKQADLVITSRFHGLLFSLISNTPVIATGNEGGKIHRLIHNTIPCLKHSFIPMSNFNLEVVTKKVNNINQQQCTYTLTLNKLRECTANSKTNKTLLNFYINH